jgi:hypothetical protein
MKKELILLTMLFCSLSCALQKREVISKSTIRLESKNTNIRDLIEIDGYYYMTDDNNSNCLMFFEDGTCVQFAFKRNVSENDIRANMSNSVVSWIDNKQIRWGTWWGVYKIEGDTLIVYFYDKGLSFLKAWDLMENRYRIIDRKTILRIYFKIRTDDNYYKFHSPWLGNGYPFYFNSADSLPSSDCWLKEEKWIWRNESDWKNYMEMIEQKKIRRNEKRIDIINDVVLLLFLCIAKKRSYC